LELKVTDNDAVAFARLIAKIAYASAYALGQLHRLKDKSELVMAMMKQPNAIGRFVGSIPRPYQQYLGLQHRISIDVVPENRLLCSTVQLFASAGAPSYIVVLGTLNEDDPMSNAH